MNNNKSWSLYDLTQGEAGGKGRGFAEMAVFIP